MRGFIIERKVIDGNLGGIILIVNGMKKRRWVGGKKLPTTSEWNCFSFSINSRLEPGAILSVFFYIYIFCFVRIKSSECEWQVISDFCNSREEFMTRANFSHSQLFIRLSYLLSCGKKIALLGYNSKKMKIQYFWNKNNNTSQCGIFDFIPTCIFY